MAKVVNKMPGSSRRMYPWDVWLDGRVWELTEGEDYTNAESFRQACYAIAKRKGLGVTVKFRVDRCYVQSTTQVTGSGDER